MADNLTNTDANTTQYITATNFEELKTNLNGAFNKVVSNNFYKGAKGDSVKITRVSLKDSDNTLTTEGEKVYTVIFGDGADITDKRVAAIPTEWVGHPATPLFFVYHETTDDDVFIDYSCIIYATEMTDAGGYAYSKVDGFPTIYYNRTLKDYCWKVSGTETEISARYKDTSDKSVQFFLLKKITDTEFKYWDAEGNKWVDSLTSQTPTIGDYAYVLFKKTVSVAEVNTDVLALGFAVYNSDGWKEIAYGDDLTAVTYNDAYMQYIWNTIYTSLGQEYTVDTGGEIVIKLANTFQFPDVVDTTNGHIVSSISNAERGDLWVEPIDAHSETVDCKSHALIFNGYDGVYFGAPDFDSTGAIFFDETKKLISNSNAYTRINLADLENSADNTYDSSKLYNYSFVCIDRGSRNYDNYVRYIYLNLALKSGGTPVDPYIGIGMDQNVDETFEVHYDITTDTILWMKDKWGNEADIDFVNHKIFSKTVNNITTDARSDGWFKNNIIKNAAQVDYVCINIQYDDNIKTIGDCIISDNTIICDPTLLAGFYILKLHLFEDGQNIKCINNTFINSTFNIDCGYHKRTDIPVTSASAYYWYKNTFKYDDQYSLKECVFSNNYIVDSAIGDCEDGWVLDIHRFTNNEIKKSNLCYGIYTIWAAVQFDGPDAYTDANNNRWVAAFWHDKNITASDDTPWKYNTWMLPLFMINDCKFNNFSTVGYVGFICWDNSSTIEDNESLAKICSYSQCLSHYNFIGNQKRSDNCSVNKPSYDTASGHLTHLVSSAYWVVSEYDDNYNITSYYDSFTPIVLFGFADAYGLHHPYDNVAYTNSPANQPSGDFDLYDKYSTTLSNTINKTSAGGGTTKFIYPQAYQDDSLVSFSSYIASYNQTKSAFNILSAISIS